MTPTTLAPVAEPAAPPPRRPLPTVPLVIVTVASALSVLMVFLVVFGLGLSALQEQRAQHQLYAQLRGSFSPSSPVAPPVGGLIKPGTPIALLNAPAAGLHNTVVVEGTSSGDLMSGPGHLRDSVLPGQVGQSILLGRSLTAGAPFGHLMRVQTGDLITITTGQGRFTYSVIDVRGTGSPLPAVPAGGSLLTLVTSGGSGWLGRLAPGGVRYVDATLKGKAVSDSVGRPVAVPSAELPGRSDPGSWPFVVLWLQGLVLVTLGMVWAWSRWGHWQTWLVGLSLLAGVLWGLSDQTMRLLPNLL
ncbi:MAG TPA: class E sortase [Mycobacteriales bacterium]|jgi:sortase A|nr:class E sortase [Mycobacteriales bacterium]